MKRPLLSSCTIIGALALTLGLSDAGLAQYAPKTKSSSGTAESGKKRIVQPVRRAAAKQTRSATRISVTKQEAGGEVDLPARSDTATVVFITSPLATQLVPPPAPMNTDAIRRMIDTMGVRAIAPSPYLLTPFGVLYVGLAGGASIPSGDIYNGYNPGTNLRMSLGLESLTGLTGLRLDVAYDQLRGRPTFRNNGQTTTIVTTFGGGYSTPTSAPVTGSGGGGASGGSSGYTGTATVSSDATQLWSAMLDGKLRLPFFSSRASTEVYVLAGGGIHYFRNYGGTFARTNPAAEQARFPNAAPYDTSGSGYSSGSAYAALTRFGANGGVGLQWGLGGLGGAALFVEGRYVTIFTRDRRTNYWPVVLGVTSR